MTIEQIAELYRFNGWANARARRAAAALTPEAFTRDLKNSFPSVRDTLAHMLGAEWIWLERWRGVSPPALPKAAEFPDAAAIETRWRDIERGQAEFIAALTPDALERRIDYTNTRGQPFSYPLRQMLLHVVNHATYHRGQITTMLRQLGARPVPTDLLVYHDEAETALAARTR